VFGSTDKIILDPSANVVPYLPLNELGRGGQQNPAPSAPRNPPQATSAPSGGTR
jgi:hypothetical protein